MGNGLFFIVKQAQVQRGVAGHGAATRSGPQPQILGTLAEKALSPAPGELVRGEGRSCPSSLARGVGPGEVTGEETGLNLKSSLEF